MSKPKVKGKPITAGKAIKAGKGKLPQGKQVAPPMAMPAGMPMFKKGGVVKKGGCK